ncbi:MAG TPA: hypothetical protein DD727_10045 [Clostridiales bacterium]|nr:hypothetical protein [Clostridiales bacterium]
MDWSKIPEDGYDTVLRDFSTMQWTIPLVKTYEKVQGDSVVPYLKYWIGYWADYSLNWLSAHQKVLADSKLKGLVNGTINWASKSRLYFAWRLNTFFSYLPTAAGVSATVAKKDIDSLQLAQVLMHFAKWEIPAALQIQNSGIGTPNQYIHCSMGLLYASVMMSEFKEAPVWYQNTLEQINTYIEGSGYLPDGTDQEQSFNYNKGFAPIMDELLAAIATNTFKGDYSELLRKIKEAKLYRERFLVSLLMPDGNIPSAGTHNNLGYDRKKAVDEYQTRKDSSSDLTARIENCIFGGQKEPVPSFDSIYFPYGGYVIFRNGWDRQSLYAFMKTSRPASGHMRESGNGVAITAYGLDILVNSGSNSYSQNGMFNKYFDSTLSQNSISVDGYSQKLLSKPAEPPLTETIPARWSTSDKLDFAEGFYKGTYEGYNFLTNSVGSQKVEDVTHNRQIIFLKSAGCWIITDLMNSPGKHTYTQSWNFNPVYGLEDINLDPAGKSIISAKKNSVNIAVYHSGQSTAEYHKYYGVNRPDQLLGWVAKTSASGTTTPAVDTHTTWEGSGKQQLITLLIPSSNEDVIDSYTDISDEHSDGFSVVMNDGTKITYLHTREENNEDLKIDNLLFKCNAVLLVSNSEHESYGITLGCTAYTKNAGKDGLTAAKIPDFEFILSGSTIHIKQEISIPEKFNWKEYKGTVIPQY